MEEAEFNSLAFGFFVKRERERERVCVRERERERERERAGRIWLEKVPKDTDTASCVLSARGFRLVCDNNGGSILQP